jgi:hypothetical protein
LTLYENELRKDHCLDPIIIPDTDEENKKSKTEELNGLFKKTLLTFISAEPYRRTESNYQIQSILHDGCTKNGQ